MLFSVNKTPLFPLALGGAGLGSDDRTLFFGRTVSDKEAADTVLWCLQNGINLIDTSPFYGSSERRIGIAIKEYGKRDSFLLSTKAGTHPLHKGYTAELFKRSIASSLEALHTDRIDIVHIHDPSKEDMRMVMGKNGGLETLLSLKEQGVIRYIGLGVRDHALHQEFIRSGHADVILPYLDHNLLRQTAGPLLNSAKAANIPVLMGSPLCMGLLSGKDPRTINVPHFDVKKEVSFSLACRMYDQCAGTGMELKALNFQFILAEPAIHAVICGATSIAEAEENLRAFSKKYPAGQVDGFFSQFATTNKTEANT